MRPRVGLFVTCLVDLLRPAIGFASVRLLEASGCDVVVPGRQTCCGQPAYNSGDSANSRAIASNTIHAFRDCDYVVAPSGSCASMLRIHYQRLFDERADPTLAGDATAFSERVHELTSFLVGVRGMKDALPGYKGRVTYHDACSGLRELGIRDAPRKLLRSLPGVELVEMTEPEACCGFGGLFATKHADISNAIVSRKAEHASAAGVDLLLAGDLGCLMNIAGKLARLGSGPPCRHVAEVLAGDVSAPPISGRPHATRRKGSP